MTAAPERLTRCQSSTRNPDNTVRWPNSVPTLAQSLGRCANVGTELGGDLGLSGSGLT